MKARFISPQGTIEAEGSPEELAKFFREYSGWTLAGLSVTTTTLGPIRLTSAPVSVPTPWFDTCTDGGQHEYPSSWMSVSPAPCKKCGASSGPVLPSFTCGVTTRDLGALVQPIVAHTNTCAATVGVGSA